MYTESKPWNSASGEEKAREIARELWFYSSPKHWLVRFGYKHGGVYMGLNARDLHTWRGKEVMSFVHLLGLTIAQDRATKAENSDNFHSRINGHNACFPRRVFITMLYCGCFFSFGTTMAILGPTLIELGHLVHHGLDMMSWLFFTQAAYALLGASVAGILLDR